ncbi:hypothetical protein GS682_16965 [Nostoc sp. B(2019)]|nr:hypothetical protein [Nostoc sp. B(2019)]
MHPGSAHEEASQVRGAIAALSMLSPPSIQNSNFDKASANNTRISAEFHASFRASESALPNP